MAEEGQGGDKASKADLGFPLPDSVVIISAQTDRSCEQGASCPLWLRSGKLVGDVLLVSCHCV